jgi:hypothetical protein
MQSYRELPLDVRRTAQEELGLFEEPDLGLQTIKRIATMPPLNATDEKTQQTMGMYACSPAQSALNRMAQAMEQQPTWRQVAVHELQRAIVYVPIFVVSTLVTLWANRKLPNA